MEIWCFDGSLIVNTSGRFHSLNEGGLRSAVDEYTFVDPMSFSGKERVYVWLKSSIKAAAVYD